MSEFRVIKGIIAFWVFLLASGCASDDGVSPHPHTHDHFTDHHHPYQETSHTDTYTERRYEDDSSVSPSVDVRAGDTGSALPSAKDALDGDGLLP